MELLDVPGLLPNVRSELELGGVAIDRFTSPFGCGLGISYLKRIRNGYEERNIIITNDKSFYENND